MCLLTQGSSFCRLFLGISCNTFVHLTYNVHTCNYARGSSFLSSPLPCVPTVSTWWATAVWHALGTVDHSPRPSPRQWNRPTWLPWASWAGTGISRVASTPTREQTISPLLLCVSPTPSLGMSSSTLRKNHSVNLQFVCMNLLCLAH